MASASPLKRSLTGRNVQLTLALLKPDICAKPDLPPRIYEAIKSNNLDIVTKRNVLWTLEEAGQFYAEHKGKFFYERLCGYMTRYKKKGYFLRKRGFSYQLSVAAVDLSRHLCCHPPTPLKVGEL